MTMKQEQDQQEGYVPSEPHLALETNATSTSYYDPTGTQDPAWSYFAGYYYNYDEQRWYPTQYQDLYDPYQNQYQLATLGDSSEEYGHCEDTPGNTNQADNGPTVTLENENESSAFGFNGECPLNPELNYDLNSNALYEWQERELILASHSPESTSTISETAEYDEHVLGAQASDAIELTFQLSSHGHWHHQPVPNGWYGPVTAEYGQVEWYSEPQHPLELFNSNETQTKGEQLMLLYEGSYVSESHIEERCLHL